MKYENKRTGQVAELVSRDDKYKTVILEYPGGKSVSITESTLKRWWKPLEDEEIEKLDDMKEEVTEVLEELAGDGTPLAEVGEEIAEPAKNKAKAVRKSDSQMLIQNRKQAILATLNKYEGVNLLLYDKLPNLIVVKNKDKKSVFELRVTRNGVTFNCKEASVPDGLMAYKVNNYYMPFVIKADVEQYEEVLIQLLYKTIL